MKKKDSKKEKTFYSKKHEIVNTVVNISMWLIFGLVVTLGSELLQRESLNSLIHYLEVNFKMFITNYLIVLSITAIAFIFKKSRVLYLMLISIILTASLVSGVIEKFRGTPLIWADLYSIKEGLIIAQNYLDKEIIIPIVIGMIIFILLIITLWKTENYNKESKKNIKRYINIYGIVLTLFAILVTNGYITYLEKTNKKISFQWDIPASYGHNGFLYSFLETAAGFKVDKPKDYNKQNIQEISDELNETNILASNTNVSHDSYNAENPNVIIIQLESFMDPSTIQEIEVTNDVIKNYRKIYNNYPHGILGVPCYGGGTVRSEFEVLTGLTTDFLPVGEIPNNNILKKQPVESLAYILRDYGYNVSVVHNYIGNFYDRDLVYPNLGFENYISMEYMDEPTNNITSGDAYPEDMLNLKPIEELLGKENPQFIYNITVESHGSYAEDLKNVDFKVKDKTLSAKAISQLQGYFNKLKGVDKYIGQLINYLNTLKEPTVVLMFSDHLPSLEVLNKKNTFINSKEKYETQYAIWNNIGLANGDKNLEAYQLSTYLLDSININSGIIPTFHKVYSKEDNYDRKFEDIQYDILFGNQYIYNGTEPYKKTNLHMGLKDIKVNDYYLDGKSLIVKGENFTSKSNILIEGKSIPTQFIDENTLLSSEPGKNIKDVSVGQVGKYNKILSSSNTKK